MIYRCLIVDDNLIDRHLITKCLNKIDGIIIAAVCADGFEASKVLADQHIDILFSDIEMPYLSGIDLVKTLNPHTVTIFITSHKDYAVEGFNLNVIDFIVKPLNFDRFYTAVNKAIAYITLKNIARGDSGAGNDKEVSGNTIITAADCFFLKDTNGITRVKYSEVFYIESLGDYSKVFTQNGGKHVTLVSLKSMQRQLPEHQFKRIHKQYIVNLFHIVTITANEVVLFDKQIVPINTAARQEVLELLTNNKLLTR
ncbi:MAG TPA: LytTR family DNA-binding domain-containing protein [Mucilaginibacter sp.]